MAVSFFDSTGKVLLLAGIATNLLIIWELRRIQPALIMCVFFLSYVLYLLPYYFGDFLIAGHDKYYKIELYNQALGIHVLFLTVFYFALNVKINSGFFLIRDLIRPYNNIVIFLLLYAIMSYIVVSIQGDSVMNSSNSSYLTYMENLEKQGGSLEYFYILFICAFFFTSNRMLRNSLLILVVIYCYNSVLRGYRIQFIQMVFLTFVLFFDGKFKTSYVIVFALIGFLASEVIGILKNVGSVSYEELLKLFDNSKGIILTNQTDVFYSSVVFLGLIRDGIYSLPVRAWSALGFVLNWIIPSSLIWKEARVPEFAKQFTSLGGGGLISAYFFVWFGYLGTLGIGCSLAFFLNNVYNKLQQNIYKVVGILLLSTYPRWFAYDPGNFLFRLPIYLFLLFHILRFINLWMIKR
jgi:hypothetical protein